MREIGQHEDQPPQPASNRQVHPLPDHPLRLRIGFRISTVVQDFNQANLRAIELLDDPERMIVPALVNLVTVERWANKDGDHELALLTGHLHDREHRPCAGALSTRADHEDDRVAAQQRLDLGPGFLERLRGHMRIVPRTQQTGGSSADEHAFFLRDVRQRELVGVEKPRRHGPAKAVGVFPVCLLRHHEVLTEQRLDGTQNRAAPAAQAQEENVHLPPSCLGSVANRHGTTTQRPRAYTSPVVNRVSAISLTTRMTSYVTFPRWSVRLG